MTALTPHRLGGKKPAGNKLVARTGALERTELAPTAEAVAEVEQTEDEEVLEGADIASDPTSGAGKDGATGDKEGKVDTPPERGETEEGDNDDAGHRTTLPLLLDKSESRG